MYRISTVYEGHAVFFNFLRETPHSSWVQCPTPTASACVLCHRLQSQTPMSDNIFTSEVNSRVEKLLPSVVSRWCWPPDRCSAQTPAFEVASIKPSEPITPAMVAAGKLHAGMKIDGKRVDIGNFSLMQLICKAYDVKPYQVSGPSWLQAVGLAGQRFDIVANLPEGATKEQVPQMLQNLLAERFKLAIHQASKDQAVYAMVIGKGGPEDQGIRDAGGGARWFGAQPGRHRQQFGEHQPKQGRGDGLRRHGQTAEDDPIAGRQVDAPGNLRRHAGRIGRRAVAVDGPPGCGHDGADGEISDDAGHLHAGPDECRQGGGSGRASGRGRSQ